MRKLLLLLLVCVFAYCSTANALGRVMVYESVNKAGVGDEGDLAGQDYTSTAVPTGTIIPKKDKILGFCIVPNDPTLRDVPTDNVNETGLNLVHAELIVGLHDSVWDPTYATVGANVAELIAEAEAGVNGNDGYTWFPYPLTINTQLIIHQGANSIVLIYYAR